MLGVVGEEAKAAVEAGAIAHAVHIVWIGVAYESGDGGVDVPGEEDDEHVIDKIIHIEQILVSRIGRAIDIEPLDFEIIRVRGEAIGGRLPEASPGIHVAVRGVNGVAGAAGINFDDVIILFVPPKVGFAKRGLGPLVGVE